MVTAVPQDQWRLLDVQAHDTRLAQIAHRRTSLPEHAELAALAERARTQGDRLVAARTLVEDITRELAKAEADVEQVRQRAARDQARLDSGQGSPKDLQALQHEVASLAARQSALEDVELEVMERLEQAGAELDQLKAEADRLDAETADATQRRDAALATLDDEAAGEQRARADAVAGLPADLIALYEKIRANNGGVGAARIYQRRCEGCRLELNTTDIGRLRDAPENAVIRCEECGRIQVRTADSGL
ncbi:MAG: C4-type zinc ribbon domain-containing protein [Kineosporiaceae bacterium]